MNAVCKGGVTLAQPALSTFTSTDASPERESEAEAVTDVWEMYQPLVPEEPLMSPVICGVVTSK